MTDAKPLPPSDVDLNDPGLYDVLINTAVLSREAAMELLADVAPRPDLSTTAALTSTSTIGTFNAAVPGDLAPIRK